MQKQTAFIRETVLNCLRRSQDFDGMVVAEIDGTYFSAADIALPDSDNNCQSYRLIVIKHA